MPPANPVWLEILRAVGNELQLSGHEKPQHLGIEQVHTWWPLPEASMLASLKNPRTQALFFENVARFMDLLVYSSYRIGDLTDRPTDLYFPLSKWRLILAATEAETKQGRGRTAEKRAEVSAILERMFATYKDSASVSAAVDCFV